MLILIVWLAVVLSVIVSERVQMCAGLIDFQAEMCAAGGAAPYVERPAQWSC